MPIEGFRPCCMHVQHAESSSLRTAWHVHPPSNGYILLGGEKGRERIFFVRDSSLYRFERGLPFFSSQIFPSSVDMISGDTRSCRDGYDFFVCKPSCFFKIVECSMFSSLSEKAFITRNFFSPLIEIGKIFFLQIFIRRQWSAPLLFRYGGERGSRGRCNPESMEIETSARFHRGRESLVATFPANLFHEYVRGRGKRGRRTPGNSALS